MKKYLMIAAVLVGQVFAAAFDKVDADASATLVAAVGQISLNAAADSAPVLAPVPVHVPLTARFITAADLLDESAIHANMMGFVGADTDAKWLAAKVTMQGQIDAGTFRRVLFFRGGELITSSRSGGMPTHIFPATAGAEEGVYEFTNGQESIAAVYRELLAGKATVEDLFAKPGFAPGLTWRIRETVADADPQEILAATLMPNDVVHPALLVEMHKAAYALFAGVHLSGVADRLPSLYISMVLNVPGIAEADFGEHLGLQGGLHNYFPANVDGMRYILAGILN